MNHVTVIKQQSVTSRTAKRLGSVLPAHSHHCCLCSIAALDTALHSTVSDWPYIRCVCGNGLSELPAFHLSFQLRGCHSAYIDRCRLLLSVVQICTLSLHMIWVTFSGERWLFFVHGIRWSHARIFKHATIIIIACNTTQFNSWDGYQARPSGEFVC